MDTALARTLDTAAGPDRRLVTLFPVMRTAEAPPLDQVVEGPLTFHAFCEQHALSFVGRAFVGYVPTRELIGISKLTRIVRQSARCLSHHERMGEEIATMLAMVVRPVGVAACIEASHPCVHARGSRFPTTRTTVWHGRYESDASLRSDFLARCRP